MNDDLDRLLEHFKGDGLPKMQSSAFALIINSGEPDARLCLEVGAAVLLDKPILLFSLAGQAIPANLARLASAVVQGDMKDPDTKARLTQAILDLMKNDPRIPKSRPE